VKVNNGSIAIDVNGNELATLLELAPRSLVPVSPASLTIVDLDGRPRLRAFNLTAYDDDAEPPD